MQDPHTAGQPQGEFDNTEGLALALNYLKDPSAVPCPECGPGTIEVVAYLDADGIQDGVVRSADPEGDYTVVLYCHDCRRAAALDLSPTGGAHGGEEQDGDAEDGGGGHFRAA